MLSSYFLYQQGFWPAPLHSDSNIYFILTVILSLAEMISIDPSQLPSPYYIIAICNINSVTHQKHEEYLFLRTQPVHYLIL